MRFSDIVSENKLDISEVSLQKLLSGQRLDAEVYSRDYLLSEERIARHQTVLLGEQARIFRKGIFDIKADCYLEEGGIPFVRLGNVKNGIITTQDLVQIPEEEQKKNKKTALERGDIVLAKTANPAASYVNLTECNVSQDAIALKLDKQASLTSEYLVVFLNTKYGLLSMRRWFTGNIQMHLNLEEAKAIKIPTPSKEFIHRISEFFQGYLSNLRLSEVAYEKAEATIKQSLGITDDDTSEKNVSVRSLVDAIKVDRFDAEYWQPKYDAMLKRIATYKGGVSTVGEQFTTLKNNFKLEAERTYRYIEIGDVSTSNGEVGYTELPAVELPANAKIEFGERQLIASKVRPNRGAVAILDDHKGYLGSGAFTVLKEKGRVPLEVLMVYLKTEPIRDLLLRYNVGTSYPVIRDEDILNLPVPLLNEKDTADIVKNVITTHKNLAEAKTLINLAKRAVEVFIEKDENAALKVIETTS